MENNIIIRPITVEDAESYVKLVNYVWRITYKHIFPEEVFLDRESNLDEKIEKFKKKAYNDNSQIMYVAEDNGKIVGVIWGKTISDYTYFAERGYAELLAIYILPEYQGYGIGSKFKNLYLDFARKNSADKFVIGVLKENLKARKVYESWGAKLDSHTEPFVKLGVGYDEVFYTYDLK